MKTNIYFIWILIIITSLSFESCDLFDFEDDEPEVEVELYTNPTDPTIAKIISPDGTTVTAFGIKDEQGYPVSIQSIIVNMINFPGETIILYDSLSHPVKVVTANNTTYHFNWINESKIRVGVISPNGEVQFNFPINLNDETKLSFQTQNKKENIRKGIHPDISANPAPINTYHPLSTNPTPNPKPNQKGTTQTVVINRCGEPVRNAVVLMELEPAVGSFKKSILTYSEDAHYQFNVPTPPENTPELKKMCEKVRINFTSLCFMAFLSKLENDLSICNTIEKFVKDGLYAADDPQVIKVRNACEEMYKAIMVSCGIISNNEELFLDFCKNILGISNAAELSKYSFKVTVSAPGQETYTTTPIEFDPSQSNTWTYSLPEEPTVSKLYTEPGDPIPLQGYTIFAQVLCPSEEGTDVTLTITGDDGYSNSRTITVNYNTEVFLYVPGAKESVVDKITATIGNITWQTYVVF